MPQIIRISKIFSFEAAHALLGHDGLCSNIHGHSYKLKVTVAGKPMQMIGHPKNGMVMDISDLKKIVQEKIIGPLDHSLLLNEETDPVIIKNFTESGNRIVLCPFQPTVENLLIEMINKILPALPENVRLQCLYLCETESSYAEWFFEDQVKNEE